MAIERPPAPASLVQILKSAEKERATTHPPPWHRPPGSRHQRPKHPSLPSSPLPVPDQRGQRCGARAQGRSSDPVQRQQNEFCNHWIFQTTRGSSRSGRRWEKGDAEITPEGTSSLEEEKGTRTKRWKKKKRGTVGDRDRRQRRRRR